MAKIKRTVSSDVAAPDLTQNLQGINIPQDAFGQNVGAALSNLGESVSDSSNRLNLAVGRMEERKNQTVATKAAATLSFDEFNQLETLKSKTTTDYDRFGKKYYDEAIARAEAVAKTLPSKRASELYMEKAVPTIQALGRNGIAWGNQKFIETGFEAGGSAINGLISSAAAEGLQADLALKRSQIQTELEQMRGAGYLAASKVSFKDLLKSSLTKLDLAMVDSLVQANPASLIEAIDKGKLEHLDKEQVGKAKRLAIDSLKRVDEQAKFSKFVEDISKNSELLARIDAGDPTLTVAQINSYDINQWAKDYWIEQLSGSEEGKIRKAVKAKEVLLARNKELGLVNGKQAKGKMPKLSETAKNINASFLYDEAARIDKIEEPAMKLNAALNLMKTTMDAHDKGEIFAAERRNILGPLMDSILVGTDSKYWEPTQKQGFIKRLYKGLAVPFGGGFPTTHGNPYMDSYNEVLDRIKDFPKVNNVDGKQLAMTNVIKHIEIAKTLDDKDKQEYVKNISRNALIDVLKEIHPMTKDIPYDDYANIVGMTSINSIPNQQGDSFGLRQDGTKKGTGFLGVLDITASDGRNGVATEYSVMSDAVKLNGERIEFPTLVPTLTKDEVNLMVNDIIPNKKSVPEPIMQKAIIHALDRMKRGRTPFIEVPTQSHIDTIIKNKDNIKMREFFVDSFGQAALDKALNTSQPVEKHRPRTFIKMR
mgnify:FL=1